MSVKCKLPFFNCDYWRIIAIIIIILLLLSLFYRIDIIIIIIIAMLKLLTIKFKVILISNYY